MAGFWAIDGTAKALQLLVDAGLTVHLFSGPLAPSAAAGAEDFSEPADSAYRPKQVPTGWVVKPGEPSTASHAQLVFEFAANIGSVSVHGYFITCQGALVCVERFRRPDGEYQPIVVTMPGSQVRVTPTITMLNKQAA